MAERRYSRSNLQRLSNEDLQDADFDARSLRFAIMTLGVTTIPSGICLAENPFIRIPLIAAGAIATVRAEIAHTRVRRIGNELERRKEQILNAMQRDR